MNVCPGLCLLFTAHLHGPVGLSTHCSPEIKTIPTSWIFYVSCLWTGAVVWEIERSGVVVRVNAVAGGGDENQTHIWFLFLSLSLSSTFTCATLGCRVDRWRHDAHFARWFCVDKEKTNKYQVILCSFVPRWPLISPGFLPVPRTGVAVATLSLHSPPLQSLLSFTSIQPLLHKLLFPTTNDRNKLKTINPANLPASSRYKG